MEHAIRIVLLPFGSFFRLHMAAVGRKGGGEGGEGEELRKKKEGGREEMNQSSVALNIPFANLVAEGMRGKRLKKKRKGKRGLFPKGCYGAPPSVCFKRESER